MAPNTHSIRKTLLVTAASVVVLAACSPSSMIDKLTGNDGRVPQHVDGPRRAPILNPEPSPQKVPPASTSRLRPPPPPPEAYEPRGNAVQEKPAGDEAPDVRDYFNEFFGQDAGEGKVRKPIADNPYIEEEMVESAPPMVEEVARPAPRVEYTPPPVIEKPAAPVAIGNMHMDDAPRADRTVAAFSPMVDSPSPAAPASAPEVMAVVDEEVQAAPAMEEEAPASTFFSRLFSPLKSKPDDGVIIAKDDTTSELTNVKTASDAGDDAEEDYPSLSSVPATPQVFSQVRNEKTFRMQELQIDHAMAQESKQQLDAEPSQLQVNKPVEDQGEPFVPSPVAEKSMSSDEPVLLGQMGDNKAAPKTEMSMEAKPAPIEYAADEEVPPAKVMVKEEAESSEPWWERWNVTVGKDKESAPEMVEEKVPAVVEAPAPKAVVDTPKAAPVIDARPDSTVAAFKPLTPQVTQPVAAPVEYAAPAVTKPTAAMEAATGEEDSKEADGLPSPGMLDKVKTLPPSRYKNRDREFYLVP
ncbi:MAG: hypothetical protein ACN2B6_08390 [Rickettsiales bacterium]